MVVVGGLVGARDGDGANKVKLYFHERIVIGVLCRRRRRWFRTAGNGFDWSF